MRVEVCKAEKLLLYSYNFSEDDISKAIYHLKDIWGIEQIRMGMGSFISLDNVYKTNFYRYEGLYTTTPNAKMSSDCFTKSGRKYLCRYQKGTWDRLPVLYQKMLDYARKIIYSLMVMLMKQD